MLCTWNGLSTITNRKQLISINGVNRNKLLLLKQQCYTLLEAFGGYDVLVRELSFIYTIYEGKREH